MTGTRLETSPQPTPFARNCSMRSMLSPTTRSRGRVTDEPPDGTSSRAFHSAWSTVCAVMKSKSSPSLTAGDGRATGGPASERPSNFRIQRLALRAAADPGRSAGRSTRGALRA